MLKSTKLTPNCIQADLDDPKKCEFCKQDYYANTAGKCTICTSTNRKA